MSTVTVRSESGDFKLLYEPGVTLLDVLRSESFDIAAPCGGQGKCGKCAVTLISSDGKRERVNACQILASDVGDRVVIAPDSASGGEIQLSGALISGAGGLRGYAAALDIGTTTLAVRIVDRASGETLASASAWNAQAPYGADVISRIKHASRPEGLDKLTALARNQARELIITACGDAGIAQGEIDEILCCGNTTMEHIFAGISPESLGRAPYTPATYFTGGEALRDEAFPNAAIRLAPCVSGFVGGDTVAAVHATGMAGKSGVRLLMDIGTNGELVLGGKDGLISCSVACGPAFEGAEISCGMRSVPGAISAVRFAQGEFWYVVIGGGYPKGICGTGIVDALAEMLRAGVVDGTGRLLEPDELPKGLRETVSVNKKGNVSFTVAPGVKLRAADIRKLQLAKAAVRAGVDLLMERAGVTAGDIDEVCLAGGFGTRLNIKSAAAIGLIPPELADKTRAVGNAALDGVHLALCEPDGAEKLLAIRERCEYMELAGSAEFSDAFVDAMAFHDEDD
ncbi:MAG TPA: DUF4445 domain-containing protein [Candidatus Scatomorpha merdigallinarum]|nr:DUF4445 domain-containing protein [Candidatus Scatomorpha merdigallinarum]